MDLTKLFVPLTIVLVLSSLSAGFYMSTSMAFHENPSTYAYFNKVADMPHEFHKKDVSSEYFWTHGGDCDERAREFRLYLESKGATNIQTIEARNVQNGKFSPTKWGSYGHTFLLWDGRVYNPALNKTVRFYGTDLDGYKELLKTEYYGLNTLYYENGTIEQL